MEYELHEDGTVTPLPKQNIDTGMGLERAATILQDVVAVYETDGYRQIMDWIAGRRRGLRRLRGGDEGAPDPRRPRSRDDVPHRRRRRALQRGSRLHPPPHHPPRRPAGAHDRPRRPLARSSDIVVEQMGQLVPGALEHREQIRSAAAEEERFSQTLERGLKLFEEIAAGGAISGEDAFTLADTYGFPIELTRELADERGLAGRRGGIREADGGAPRGLARGRCQASSATSAARRREFIGYEKIEVLTAISASSVDDGRFRAKLFESPFYPAGGGQVTDRIHRARGDRRARRARGADRVGDDQVLTFEGEGFAEGDRVRAVVAWRAASRRWRTTPRHTCCTGRSATSSATMCGRRARPSGPTSSGSTSRTARRCRPTSGTRSSGA